MPDAAIFAAYSHDQADATARDRREVIFGFEKEADAVEWIKDKSRGWLIANR